MVIKIQTSDKSNGNKGSSMALANYLEKEDLQKENEAFERGELPMPRTGFFSHKNDGLMKSEVIEEIDNNKKGLSKNDSKFYAINIAPSEKEQEHILSGITGREIRSISELSKNELERYENILKDYSRKVMDEYAVHFKRENITCGDQLLYFGKIEHERHYKGTELAVKQGIVKSGTNKPGLNSHVHVIVSRKDRDMKLKLSPLANDKGNGKKCITNGKNVQRGFDRNLFNVKAEQLFDKNFNYNRSLNERVEYRIQISKDPLLKAQIELEKDKGEKDRQEQKVISDFDKRNGYSEKDKEINQEIKPVIDKSNEKELSI
ncbi:DUF5712 family protein [Gaetbulibacter sp. M240]|uniref:DUF5712 family protein n=1 Tax=Gaetbulibacter sp. M240 TaxID=3126511 RepID=UPI00374ED959